MASQFQNQKLWVLKSKGEKSSFGGNSGYPDVITSYYIYDTTVKNHDKIKKGDFIVLVNRFFILGYATITSISIQKGVKKTRYRCPVSGCNTQEHYLRKSISPKYKCRNKHEFDVLKEEHIVVDEFTAHYENTFKVAPENTSVKLLDQYYIRRNLYYSIQMANPGFLKSQLFSFEINADDLKILQADPDFDFNGNLEYVPTEKDERQSDLKPRFVRNGQMKFKNDLIKAYGSFCMITGCNISRTIEASHICPYRGKKDNNVRNGLLLRVDLHRLYDNNLLSIDPKTLKVKIHPSLSKTYYKQYDGQSLIFQEKNRIPSLEALKIRWEQFQQNELK